MALGDISAGLLGSNLWLSLVLVPAVYGGTLGVTWRVFLCVLPLVPLGVGLVRRSSLLLLLAYPAALLLPVCAAPRIATGLTQPLAFSIAAASLVGYLWVVSFFAAPQVPRPQPHAVVRAESEASWSR